MSLKTISETIMSLKTISETIMCLKTFSETISVTIMSLRQSCL